VKLNKFNNNKKTKRKKHIFRMGTNRIVEKREKLDTKRVGGREQFGNSKDEVDAYTQAKEGLN
jgi:hypothetical protein